MLHLHHGAPANTSSRKHYGAILRLSGPEPMFTAL